MIENVRKASARNQRLEAAKWWTTVNALQSPERLTEYNTILV